MQVRKRLATTVASAVAAAATVTGVAFAVASGGSEPTGTVTLISPASDSEGSTSQGATPTDSATAATETPTADVQPDAVVVATQQPSAAPTSAPATVKPAPAKPARSVGNVSDDKAKTANTDEATKPAPAQDPEPEVVYESVPPTVPPPVIPEPAPGSPEAENLMPPNG